MGISFVYIIALLLIDRNLVLNSFYITNLIVLIYLALYTEYLSVPDQLRDCARRLLQLAFVLDTPLLCTTHVTSLCERRLVIISSKQLSVLIL